MSDILGHWSVKSLRGTVVKWRVTWNYAYSPFNTTRRNQNMYLRRSQKFQADVSAGEEENMEKEEPDFRGRDFEKQFACIFRDTQKVERGTFGKVKKQFLIEIFTCF